MKRLIPPLLTGLWGGSTMLAMSGSFSDDPGLITAAALGATVAGAATAPLFAKPHALWALAASILATSLGAALVGAYVGFPGDLAAGLVVAPVMVWTGIAQTPTVLLVWLVGAVVVRRLTRRLTPAIP